MIEQWAAALEATPLAAALRESVWSYPLVNTAHIFGVALLVGSIVSLDLHLLGAWPSVPLPPLWSVLHRSASAGLILAIFFGALLFMTRASEYVASALFAGKMAFVAAGTFNALLLRRAVSASLAAGRSSLPVRFGAGISLMAWLSALTLGRLVGYF